MDPTHRCVAFKSEERASRTAAPTSRALKEHAAGHFRLRGFHRHTCCSPRVLPFESTVPLSSCFLLGFARICRARQPGRVGQEGSTTSSEEEFDHKSDRAKLRNGNNDTASKQTMLLNILKQTRLACPFCGLLSSQFFLLTSTGARKSKSLEAAHDNVWAQAGRFMAVGCIKYCFNGH